VGGNAVKNGEIHLDTEIGFFYERDGLMEERKNYFFTTLSDLLSFQRILK
jgi:hypothetical protein